MLAQNYDFDFLASVKEQVLNKINAVSICKTALKMFLAAPKEMQKESLGGEKRKKSLVAKAEMQLKSVCDQYELNPERPIMKDHLNNGKNVLFFKDGSSI